MWYPPNQPYRRRMRRGIGFPFIFPFIILFWFHSGSAFFATLVLAIMVALILKVIDVTSANSPGQSQQQTPYYQPPSQTYQSPYYQPSGQTYQPPAQAYQPDQQEYKSYEQGYQAASTPYQADEQQSASSVSSYEDYEQPHAQYPEQMPPMQQ